MTPTNVSLPYNAADFSNTGGPLQVSFPAYFNAITSWIGNAFGEQGFTRLNGFFDGRLFGWSYFAYTVDPTSQTRSSSETAFLREALRETTNLNFYKQTQAKKIILNDCKTATGVLVNTARVEYTISAAKEVIVSAGSVSPSKLLVLDLLSSCCTTRIDGSHGLVLLTATPHGFRHRSSLDSESQQCPPLRRPPRCRPEHVGQLLLRPNLSSQRANPQRPRQPRSYRRRNQPV